MDIRLYISFFFNARENAGKNPIYMRITISGKRETIDTRVSETSQNRDSSKARIKGNDQTEFSGVLRLL